MPEAGAPLGVGEVGEASSMAGSVLAQLINVVRTVIAHVMEWIRKVIGWAGEHPLAFTVMVVNFAILVS